MSVQTRHFISIRTGRITLAAVLLALVLTLFISPDSYAMDKSEKMRWQLIFLSPYSGCTNYQYQMANAYDEITSKYFELYKFENSKYQPQCMPDKKYTHYQVPDDLDLIILVYDNEIGKRELHGNDVGGLYNHIGTDKTRDHTIIICDCSNFGFSDPVWVLSHELSHFITYYLGFDQSVVEDKIHSLGYKYDQCIEGSWEATCSNVLTHVYGDHYFTKATVMAPYQPAIGKKLFTLENDTATNDSATSDTSSSVANSQIVMSMQKEITKWWLAGKINDTEYTKVLGYMVDKSGGVMTADKLPPNVILFDGPDGIKENATFYDTGSEQKLKGSLLNRIPFKSENTTDLSGTIQIPQWFKSRAYWWSQDQFWSDKDFLNGIKQLFNIGIGK